MGGRRDVHHASALMRNDDEHDKSRQVAVGTTKKSAAAICWRWFARKLRQDCEGGL
jgi:hypothetical protein